jgi:hypothetical protein
MIIPRSDYGLKFLEIVKKIKITDISFNSIKSKRGNATLEVEGNKYIFEFYLQNFLIIDNLINQRTDEIINFKQIVERLSITGTRNATDESFKKSLEDGLFKQVVLGKLETVLADIRAKQFECEAEVVFKQYKFDENYFMATCEVLIFEKKFTFKLIKRKHSIELFAFNKKDFYLYDEWFIREMKNRNENIFPYDTSYTSRDAYNVEKIIGKIIIQNIIKDKKFKLICLYNPFMKKLFE